MLVWAVAAIKQYKTSYFNFFLINAVMDPITRILLLGFHLMPLSFYPTFILLKNFSLTNRFKLPLILTTSMLVLSTSFFLGDNTFWLYLLCLIFTLLIFFTLVYKLIEHVNQTRSFSLFLIMLIFYQLIGLIKFAAILLDLDKGNISFYLASFSQIFLGIGFIFVNINTKNFPIKMEKF
jgi:hypothetical protein